MRIGILAGGASLAMVLVCGSVALAAPPPEAERFRQLVEGGDPAKVQKECLGRAKTEEERANCNFIFNAMKFEKAPPEEKKAQLSFSMIIGPPPWPRS